MLWIPDDSSVYESAQIIQDHLIEGESKEQFVLVETQGKKKIQKKFLRTLCYDVDSTHLVDLNDLIEMNSLHEAPLLDILRRRWLKLSMYTYAGEFLVSINPYKQIPGQNDNPLKYLNLTASAPKTVKTLPPHVFAIANNALNECVKPKVEDEMVSESIIVTGESGAGKTEAAKQVMNFLTLANKNVFPHAGEQADRIKNVILDSNSIFEAFGNAKTVRNDNSSRFGKYIRLQYTSDNQLWAAHTETFLLEKSRLVSVGKDDRNYHIFYQMVRGADADTRTRLQLTSVDNFKILTEGGCTTIVAEEDDVTEFTAVCQALALMNCTEAEVSRIWELLASLLHIGNFLVTATGDGKPVSVTSPTMSLDAIATLLGVNLPNFIKALTTQKIQVKSTTKNEQYEKVLNAEETRNNVKALIKWVYGGVFNWLVGKVNAAHQSIVSNVKKTVVKFIGILDIFGFEIFAVNTFEQLCINYTNELLQQQFNQLAFDLAQKEYAEEGIDWTTITYRDNQPVIDLIGLKPKGLLVILEEHSLMNRDPDDQALLSSYNKLHLGINANYSKPKFGNEGFVVKHFAGDVTYNIANFIIKNNDSLQDDLVVLFSSSSNQYLLSILGHESSGSGNVKPMKKEKSSTDLPSAGGTKMASTASVSQRFRGQLDTLITTLRSTKAFYIKTVKPNSQKKAGHFESPLVMNQLRYSGILEIVRIRREGYPTRIRYLEFYTDYVLLAHGKQWIPPAQCSIDQLKDYCKLLCADHAPPGSYQVGKTYLFLHHYVPQLMMTAVHIKKMKWATVIQKTIRKFVAVRKFKRIVKAAIKVQTIGRMKISRRAYRKLVATVEAEKKRVEAARIAEEKRKREAEEERLRKIEEERKEQERLRKEEEERLRKIEEERLRKEEEERLHKEEEERLRKIEEERLRKEEEERIRKEEEERLRKEEEERVRLAIEAARLLAAKKIQFSGRRYIAEKRNKVLITSFHTLCATVSSVKDGMAKVRDVSTKFPQVYRNKWNNYCTMFQSAASGNQYEFLKVLKLNPQRILEPDINSSRLLHYLATCPDMNSLKFLCDVMNTISLDINVTVDNKEEAKEDDEEEDDNAAAQAVTVDMVTGLPIIKSGWLKKNTTILGFKTLKKRWCSLTEESFVLYRGVNVKPAGYIAIAGCAIDRPAGNEPVIIIKKLGVAQVAKKGLFSAEAEHHVFTMRAETEAAVQDWLTPLKVAAGVRPFRDAAVKYLNLSLRSKWVKLFNKQEQTALHMVAGIPAEVQAQRNDEAIKFAAWLIENGCDVDQKDATGKTPLMIAINSNNQKMIAFLNTRQTSPTEGSSSPTRMSALNRHNMENAKVKPADASQLLLRALQLKGFSYLQIHLENFYFHDRRAVTDLVNPRVSICVLDGQDNEIEVAQVVCPPAIVNKDNLWWGYTWYMQTPLENVGENFTISMKILHGSALSAPSIVPTCKYRLDKEKIDSGPNRFNFASISPTAEKEEVRNSEVNMVRRMTMQTPRKASASTAAAVDIYDSAMDGEIEITKLYRDVEIEKFAK